MGNGDVMSSLISALPVAQLCKGGATEYQLVFFDDNRQTYDVLVKYDWYV